MTRLILLEDEPILREELSDFLVSRGYAVTPVASLNAFDQAFAPGRFDIAIVDLGLPDGDGLTLITKLRCERQRLGIIVLTARSTTHDKILGLSGGADHYLPKTTDLDELDATVCALARRLDVQAEPCWVLQGSPRQLIPPGFAAISLSGQDHTVLLALARGGEHVTRKAIVAALGEDYLTYDQRRLDTQMRRLRRKVQEACGLELPVTTLRNLGYHFHQDIEIRP